MGIKRFFTLKVIIVLVILMILAVLYWIVPFLRDMYIWSRGRDIPPKRVTGIPEEAVWGGGLDGGNWFLCNKKEGTTDRYICKIFNDYTGILMAQGEYVLRKYRWDEKKKTIIYSSVGEIPQQLKFLEGGEREISLENSFILLADGWIDDGGGLKGLYVLGEGKRIIEYDKNSGKTIREYDKEW